MRSQAYRGLSVLNDINAVSKGPRAIFFRLLRKQAYRLVMQLMRSLK